MADVLRVLYVDDEPALLELSRKFLQKHGDFEVDLLTSAKVALEHLKTNQYDAIISDYQMPEMDGITFLRQLKTSGNTTPFIIFTGRGREEVVIEALNEGADFYLQKGCEPKSQFVELSNKIRYAVTRKYAEDALHELQKRTAEIIEFFPDATFAIDREGKVIAWNRAMEEMTGIHKHAMIGKGDHEYTLPFYGERRQQLLDLIDLDDETIKTKYLYVKRNGTPLYAEVFAPALNGGKGAYLWATGSPIFDIQGNRIGAIESIRDVTERKKDEEKFLQMNRHLSLLTSITRHDINNQLTVMMGYLSILEKKQHDISLTEYLRKIGILVDRISLMIQSTKEYEQIGAQDPAWLDCGTLIDTAAKDVALGDIRLVNDIPGDFTIFADQLIVRVFFNLMDNAVRYGGKITIIRFFAEEHDGDLTLVCEDDGDGVPVGEKMKIFEHGFGKNTGMGLALSSAILSITGITITENGEPGVGARFVMTIPQGAWRRS
jgi:PAS domain S-box-containing protein